MPRRPVRRKDRAVSPVIATIILVAVAIVMAIAVAYWALGLGGTFTRYEKIEIMSMYATKSGNQWIITANLRNTGSASATINLVLINGRPAPGTYTLVSNVVGGTATNNNIPVTLDPGGSCTVTITLNAGLDENLGFTFTPGMSVEVTFHTAAGSDYPKVVVLP
jgi:flagellin-like protein